MARNLTKVSLCLSLSRSLYLYLIFHIGVTSTSPFVGTVLRDADAASFLKLQKKEDRRKSYMGISREVFAEAQRVSKGETEMEIRTDRDREKARIDRDSENGNR